jgi:sporulation protein YlmC with PRC-barrel domain
LNVRESTHFACGINTNKERKKMRRTLFAIFIGALCSLQAQDSNYSQQRSAGGQSQQPVTRLNKSSTLVGTEVRTRSNERIGDVKDVVIDLNSGRIAYFVVDASEVLDGNNSLIAVPPFAIRPGSNQRAIMVDAEREKIENLRSFSRNNYPAIRGSISQMSRWRSTNAEEQPSSRSDYSSQQRQARRATSSQGDADSDWYYYEWYVLTPDSDFSSSESRQSDQARGAYGRTESQSAYSNQQNRSTSPRAHQQSRQTQQPRQTDDRSSGYSDYSGADHGAADLETERSSSRRGNQPGENSRRGTGVSGSYQSSQSESTERSSANSGDTQNSPMQVFYGQIKDIHYGNRTLTVESDRKTLNFKVAEQPKLTLNNDEGNARLNHFHEGQWVKIEYRFENESNTAHNITETGYIATNQAE